MDLTTKSQLAAVAKTLAQSYGLIQHGTTTYIPTNWETMQPDPFGAPSEVIWMPMDRRAKQRMANHLGNVLFANDAEITNFDLMLRQYAKWNDDDITNLLIKTDEGLRVLTPTGELAEPDGSFLPNFIKHPLVDDEEMKAEVFGVIKEWLNSEEEAHSLLHHLATALSPGWSAVKYVLLIGDGRNGKSVLLSMVTDLFGRENVSSVTRQQMATALPVCTELNNKLLNIIFDGSMAYIKDSAMEKTLIAGEPASVRMLYENGNTTVQTNALFIEALQSEPKTRDKSSALQKRLSRFFFPNIYQLNSEFERNMRNPATLGAFLGLLLDHFVQENERAQKLVQTEQAIELQVEQELINSPMLQFVQHLIRTDPTMADKFTGSELLVEPLVQSFMAWRVGEGHGEYSSADIHKMFKEHFLLKRKSIRRGSAIVKEYALAAPKPIVEALINTMKGEDDGLQHEALVED